MNLIRYFTLIAALLAVTSVHAQRTPVPIVNHDNVPVATGSGQPITAEAVKEAIVRGAGAGRRKWSASHLPDGQKIRATYQVRSHTIVVEIQNTASAFSIHYADSINMKYKIEDGVPVIHPFYNVWVEELLASIRGELLKL